jgi:hypothetical protein
MSSAGAAAAAAPMSSARAAASRKNGARSRGPKTPAGKARASRNALKHGLRSENWVVLPTEDWDEFEKLERALVDELAPQGPLQSVLARRVARAAWRLMRADRLECEVFAERWRNCPRDGGIGLALIRDGNSTRSIETLMRYRGAAQTELLRSLRELKALRAEAARAATAEAPARALAPARRATLGPASPARPAAPATNPNEPERPAARDLDRVMPDRPAPAQGRPAAGPAPRPNEPERRDPSRPTAPTAPPAAKLPRPAPRAPAPEGEQPLARAQCPHVSERTNPSGRPAAPHPHCGNGKGNAEEAPSSRQHVAGGQLRAG